MLGAAVLIGALAAIAAAVLPGRRAARLSVVEALRHNV
jgi:ABC-type lipoprotein release transport system permease subunit